MNTVRRWALFAVIAAGILGFWWDSGRSVPAPPRLAILSAPSVPPVAILRPQPRHPALRRGDRLGVIQVPRLQLSVAIYEGDDAAILDRGAGHVPGTALPGGNGNICIAAHRDKFFRALRFIHPNDEIVLETDEGAQRYRVSSTGIVNPSDTQVLMPAANRDLTLITCYPFFYIGSAPHRFIVHASREAIHG